MSEVNIYEVSNKTARNVIAFVDAMVQRGAIKGEELSSIGNLRDNCIQIVQLVENWETEQAQNSEPES